MSSPGHWKTTPAAAYPPLLRKQIAEWAFSVFDGGSAKPQLSGDTSGQGVILSFEPDLQTWNPDRGKEVENLALVALQQGQFARDLLRKIPDSREACHSCHSCHSRHSESVSVFQEFSGSREACHFCHSCHSRHSESVSVFQEFSGSREACHSCHSCHSRHSEPVSVFQEFSGSREACHSCHSCHSRHSEPVSVLHDFSKAREPVIPVIFVIPVI